MDGLIFATIKYGFFLLILEYLIVFCECDCGLPAIPINLNINEISPKYKEGYVCEYKCDFEELTLIGGQFRTCSKGKWIGKIPRCAQKFSSNIVTTLEVSHSLDNNSKIYDYQSEIHSCIKSDVTHNDASSQNFFVRFNTKIRHIVYFEIDFFINHNKSLNIARAHTNDIRGCTLEKVEPTYNSSLMRYGFRCDMKFEGQEAYMAWDKDQTEGITVVFNEPVVIICNCTIFHETYTRYHWCGSNEQPLYSISEYVTGSDTFSELSLIRYSCIDGFTLIGANEVRCSSSNYWLDEFPTCVPNQTYCELHSTDSVNTDKGYKVNYENTYHFNSETHAIEGSLAIYYCEHESHVLIGDSMRVCDGSGNWIGVEPFCEDINELHKELINNAFKTSADLTIFEELQTNNSDNSCGIPAIPTFSRLADSKSLFMPIRALILKPVYKNGSSVLYKCESTYKWIYGDYNIRQCIDGEWVGNISNCYVNWEDKMLLTSIEVQKIITTNETTFNKLHIIGISARHEAGEWDHLYSYYRDISQDECATIRMDVEQEWILHFNDSQVVTHFIMNLSPFHILNISSINSERISAKVGGIMCKISALEHLSSMVSIAFDCSHSIDEKVDRIVINLDPIKSSNESIYFCSLNLLYNSKSCGKPDEPINSIMKIESNVALYSCVSGYELIGNSVIHCGFDGKWIESAPKCVPQNLCPMNSTNTSDLIVKYLNTDSLKGKIFAKHKTIALYSCNSNGTDIFLIGSRIRMCLLNGQWSGSQPICKDLISINGIIKDRRSKSNALIPVVISILLLIVIAVVVFFLIRRYDLSLNVVANYLRFRSE